MAMQSGASPLKGKMKGFAGALRATAGKPIEIGKSRLPAGINGGVAKLAQIGISAYEPDAKIAEFRGKPYFSAMGVVQLPVEHAGQSTHGLQTWLRREPLFDTPKSAGKRKTLGDHAKFMRDHLSSLGLDVDAIIAGLPEGVSDDDVLAAIEAGCKALEGAAKRGQPIYFHFRTYVIPKDEIVERNGKWYLAKRGGELGPYSSKESLIKSNPYADSEPMVNEQWEGACEFSENSEVTSAVMDNTGSTAEAADAGVEVAEGEDDATTDGGVTDETETAVATEEVDLDALAVLADEKNDAAQRQLLGLATELGVFAEADVADNWAEVATLLLAAQEARQEGVEESEEAATEEAVEDEPFVPVVGTVYRWPAGKPKKDQREIVVTKVSTKNETVLANSNTTKKPLLGAKDKKPLAIKWTALEPA